jgi:hypothetical protein
LGLPQMIQSRPQFGYLGVLFPMLIPVFLFVGFNVFNISLGGAALEGSVGINADVGLILVALVAIVLALAGLLVDPVCAALADVRIRGDLRGLHRRRRVRPRPARRPTRCRDVRN